MSKIYQLSSLKISKRAHLRISHQTRSLPLFFCQKTMGTQELASYKVCINYKTTDLLQAAVFEQRLVGMIEWLFFLYMYF